MEKVSQITTGLFLFSINFEKSLSFTQYLKIIKSTSFQGYKYKNTHFSAFRISKQFFYKNFI